MKIWILVVFAALAVVGSVQGCGVCKNMKWATCDGNAASCVCSLPVDDGTVAGRRQNINCDKLIPKCWLMKAEMYRARRNQSTRSIGDKPHETAFVDNDGIYDPDCENDGTFKAKQCNNTEECWCVNSAGVRRTDKGDKNMQCEKLVQTYLIRLRLIHKPLPGSATVDKAKIKDAMKEAIRTRYNFNSDLVKDIQYDPDARYIVVDVEKNKKDNTTHLDHMAYYMEKDVKLLPLFVSQDPLKLNVDGTTMEMENILVYYVDAEPPTFTMKNLSGGIIAVIVVVVLVVVIGLIAVAVVTKKKRDYTKARQVDN